MFEKPFIPTKNGSGYGYQPIGPSSEGGDMHDTIKADKEGNILDGHTTIRIPGGQSIHMPWLDKE